MVKQAKAKTISQPVNPPDAWPKMKPFSLSSTSFLIVIIVIFCMCVGKSESRKAEVLRS